MIYVIFGIIAIIIFGIIANAEKESKTKERGKKLSEKSYQDQRAKSVAYFEQCRLKTLQEANSSDQSSIKPKPKKEIKLESHPWLAKEEPQEENNATVADDITETEDVTVIENITEDEYDHDAIVASILKGSHKTYISDETDESKSKGNDFEFYTADIIKANGIRIKDWNQGTISPTGAMGENALNPDFFLIQKVGKSNLEYWVECKWRKSLYEDSFSLKPYQIKRYREIQKDSRRKIFILLGLGGTPYKPDKVYLIPLSLMKFEGISEDELEVCLLDNPVSNFAEYMKNFFYTYVFNRNKDTTNN